MAWSLRNHHRFGNGTLGYILSAHSVVFQKALIFISFSISLLTCLTQAYGKAIVKSVPLKTRSGPVVYTNVLGFIPMLLFANVGNEYGKLWDFWWANSECKLMISWLVASVCVRFLLKKHSLQFITDRLPPISIVLLIVGSVVGTGIGYSSWWCRSLVSATSFTLIGVMNKCLTILMNVLIWDQHATPGGIFALFICISGGMIYQQAPMRGAAPPTPVAEETDSENPDSEKMELIEKDSTGAAQKRRG